MKLDSEMFCRLNANGLDPDHVPGGIPIIDKAAICAALSGATRPQMGLALYMAGNEEEHSHIWAGLFLKASNSHLYQTFKKKNQGKLDLLIRLAIYEFTNRPHCEQCNGTAVTEDYTTCQSCNGVGLKPISNAARARVMGKRRQSWYQFSDLYTLLLKTLQQWQDANERKLNRKLR